MHIWICLFQLCKVASAAGAEEIITIIQRPKRRCSSMLWSMESMTRHNRNYGNPLHPGLAPDVLTLSCLWIQLGQDERVRLFLTIIQFTAHVILISNTYSQQAHICKSYKSPVAMGQRWSSRLGNTWSCSCGPAHRRLGSIWSLSLRAKQYGEFGSRTERLSRPF